jgi:hypothetical protein
MKVRLICSVATALCMVILGACPLGDFEDDFGKDCDPALNKPCAGELVCSPDPESKLGGVCVPERDGGNFPDAGPEPADGG